MQLEKLWDRGLLAVKVRLQLPKAVISGENKPSCEGKTRKMESFRADLQPLAIYQIIWAVFRGTLLSFAKAGE
ncbi:MAG: hypothetical protein PHE96_08490 [Methylococcales bacterium]|nr:hypothetical protein [Methylococcales bacterium]